MNKDSLDRHITGNYGEDQFRNERRAPRKRKTLCISCKEKPARLGKRDGGFDADLFCSMKCAYRLSLMRQMDATICQTCNQWDNVCECPTYIEEDEEQ
jgi:hypothetical protein